MAAKAKQGVHSPVRTDSTRISVTFEREQYELLEKVAAENKVSVAWVVRNAVEKYISDRWPLLTGGR